MILEILDMTPQERFLFKTFNFNEKRKVLNIFTEMAIYEVNSIWVYELLFKTVAEHISLLHLGLVLQICFCIYEEGKLKLEMEQGELITVISCMYQTTFFFQLWIDPQFYSSTSISRLVKMSSKFRFLTTQLKGLL